MSIASWKATTFAVDGSACREPAPAVPATTPETTRTAAAASAAVLVRIRYLLRSESRSIPGVRLTGGRFLPAVRGRLPRDTYRSWVPAAEPRRVAPPAAIRGS